MGRLTGACLFVTVFAAAPDAPAQFVSDLRNDWSDAANPNGLWAYRQGTTLLTAGTWTDDFAAQPAWVGTFPTAWLKAQSTASFDVQVGDVVTHSANLNNVVWTSPADGTVDVGGGAWMIRDIGRANDWFLRKNGAVLSSGSLSSGDPYHRANPFDFDTGTGGPLNAVPVVAGDRIELSFVVLSASGDYNGVNLTYTFTPVPEPVGLLVVIPAVAAARCGRRLRRHRTPRLGGGEATEAVTLGKPS